MYRLMLNPLKLWMLMPFALTACFNREAPDPYYLQIKDIRLAVPKAYATSGVGVDIAGHINEVRKIAAKKPGFKVDTFHMWLNGADATPWVKSAQVIGIADQMEVRLSNPDAVRNTELPATIASRISLPELRRPKKDMSGLIAYEAINNSSEISMNFIGQHEDGTSVAILCSGFHMPNPTCEASTLWRGLIVRYRFRYIYFSQWRAVHASLTSLLSSFVYA